MKCKNCGGEWNPPKNISLTVCPFCNTPIIEKLEVEKNIQPYEVIKNIVSDYGEAILADTKKLSALIMDLITEKTKEKNILGIAIHAGISTRILEANKLDSQNKELVSEQCKLFLCEDYGMNDKWAGFAVYCFTYALGWKNDVCLEQPSKSHSFSNNDYINQYKLNDTKLKKSSQPSLKDIILSDEDQKLSDNNNEANKSNNSITSKIFKTYTNLKNMVSSPKIPSVDSNLDESFNFTTNTIPNNITSIGYRAFKNSKNLISIIIPNSVTSIGTEAFLGCSNLKSIVIPNSVISIGDGVFKGCSNLINIAVDRRNQKYSSDNGMLFNYDKTKLLSYPSAIIANIPNGVNSIGNKAFADCESITSLIIPKSITSIEYNAFWGCINLKNIIVDKKNIPYSSSNGILFDYYKTRLISYPSAVDVDIPYTVTTIGYGAFGGCKNLNTINIPKNVKSISNYAFEGCINLKSIFIGEQVNFIGDSTFDGCINLIDINIDKKNKTYSSNEGMLFNYDKTKLLSYPSAIVANIPESVRSIGDSAFLNCKKLKRALIPKSVTSIGSMSFAGCENLISITIPQNVNKIGNHAFLNCNKVVIRCRPNSYAEAYCKENGIAFEVI